MSENNTDYSKFPQFPLCSGKTCQMLLDQDLVIEGDNCGHVCSNNASMKFPSGLFICEECIALLANKDKRISFPTPFVQTNTCNIVDTKALQYGIEAILNNVPSKEEQTTELIDLFKAFL